MAKNQAAIGGGQYSLTENNVKTSEFVLYIISVFFYTMMTGMMDSYRNEYFVNSIGLNSSQLSTFNVLISVVPFIISFFITMYIDGRKAGKMGKFRPLVMAVAVPMAVLLVITFLVPSALTQPGRETLLMVYITTIAIAWAICGSFGNCINMVAVVMTPNLKERDKVMSFRSISSAVGNSAPLAVVLVLDFFIDSIKVQYIVCAALCGVIGAITMFLGMNAITERTVYTSERKNPIKGFVDVVKNSHSWIIIISEFLKNFRKISTYVGIFLCAALLGSPSKFLLFGLPTGIGTAVGMLVINFLLQKFNSKVLYIASGIYSIIANTLAFSVGYAYFKNPNGALQIVFVLFLFLIGLQFGASNLLPSMFQADALEEIELQTGKRLDASLGFVVSIGTLISGTIAQALAPKLLLDDSSISIMHYVQAVEGEYPVQSFETKIALLFFYTVVHGIMMFLAGVPYFFWNLTGKKKEDLHNKLMEHREKVAKENELAAKENESAANESAVKENKLKEN